MQILRGGLDDPQVIELLRVHAESAQAATAPGSAHALDVAGLRSPDIEFWSVWSAGTLLAVGALKRLSPDHGEVKSMHVAQSMRRRGAGGALLRHLITGARAAGLSRLSLETGSWDYFQPAHALYRRYGFIECAPFGAYAPDRNSIFMTLDLNGGR